jgi:hypothetical protein
MTSKTLRVGDADRLAAANQLATHTAAGRLTLAEHDQRVTAVWAAQTRTDLEAVFADLPTLHRPDARGRAPIRVAAAVGSVLAGARVLAVWLATLAHPAWAANMMNACM